MYSNMQKIKKILSALISIVIILILYSIIDIATNTFISTGFMKYITAILSIIIAILLSRWISRKIN